MTNIKKASFGLDRMSLHNQGLIHLLTHCHANCKVQRKVFCHWNQTTNPVIRWKTCFITPPSSNHDNFRANNNNLFFTHTKDVPQHQINHKYVSDGHEAPSAVYFSAAFKGK